jgi:hypothetical protein
VDVRPSRRNSSFIYPPLPVYSKNSCASRAANTADSELICLLSVSLTRRASSVSIPSHNWYSRTFLLINFRILSLGMSKYSVIASLLFPAIIERPNLACPPPPCYTV